MFGKKIYYGWYIVAASLLIIILDGLLLYSFGVFLPYINEEFGLSRAEGSSLFSFRSLILAPGFIIAGRLIDKYDPRIVIFGGGLIAALGMILSGFAQNTWQLILTYSVMVGLGDTVLYITCVAVVSRWFTVKRAFAIGIITTGVPLSGLLTNPLAASLINNFGFRNALIALGCMMAITLLGAFVMRAYPENLGLKPYGEDDSQDKTTANTAASNNGSKDWTTMEAISTPNYWIMYLMYVLAFITFLIIVTQFYNFEIDLKISALAAAGPPAAIGLGSIIGRTVLTALLAEVLEYRKVLLVCLLAQGSSIILLLVFDDAADIWAFYLFGLLFGFFYSACVPIFPTLLARFYGLRSLGTIYGIFGTSYSIAAIGAPVLAGYVFDITGSYFYPFLFAIICCYLAALGAFFIKAPTKKPTQIESSG
ncbi:MAG: MFS transporter [Thermodesulfobacteriota bacterium]|nr:MAG: MFS transporter [Thermodesulfobacteriota bacterium]